MLRPSAALCALLLAVGCSKNPSESGTFGNGSDPSGSDGEGSGSSDTGLGSSTTSSETSAATGEGDDSTGADGSDDGDGSSSTGATCETPTVFYADIDEDGFGDPAVSMEACTAPAGYVDNADDCDDSDEDVNPDFVEICDGVDNDCDTLLDEFSAENEQCSQCGLAEFGDSIYWFCGQADVTWIVARQSCEDFGATLASVHSLQEHGFIVDNLGTSQNHWIGASDSITEGTFTWVDGSAFDYDNWAGDEPSEDGSEDCVELDAQRDMLWNDNVCSRTRSFACKAPAEPMR